MRVASSCGVALTGRSAWMNWASSCATSLAAASFHLNLPFLSGRGRLALSLQSPSTYQRNST